MKSHSSITFTSVIQWFWNFAQGMAVSLPCSVQNFKMIGSQSLWQIRFYKRWVQAEILTDFMYCKVPWHQYAESGSYCWWQNNTPLQKIHTTEVRDQSSYEGSQWETSLHCNDVSHWLGAYLGRSLWSMTNVKWVQYLMYDIDAYRFIIKKKWQFIYCHL